MTEANGDQTKSSKNSSAKQATKGSKLNGTLDQYMVPVDQKNCEEKGQGDKTKSHKNEKSIANEMEAHWKTVTEGPSGKFVQIKQEHSDESNKNQYAKLSVEDGVDDDDSFKMDDLYGPDTHEDEVDIATFERLAKEAIERMKTQSVDTLKPNEMSEPLFDILRCGNHKLKRSDIYLKDESWIRQQLKMEIKKYDEKLFIVKVDQLAKKIKITDFDDNENVEIVDDLVMELHNISEHKTAEHTLEEKVQILLEARATIKLIEEYAKDPLLMVPKEMKSLDKCSKDEIMTMNYYQLAMAVMYAQGKFENVLTKTRPQLVKQAEQLWRDKHLKDKNGTVNCASPPKKSKSSSAPIVTPGPKMDNLTDNPFNLQVPKATATILAQEHEKRKADRKIQAQNLNGINIDSLTPDEDKASYNFCVPTEPAVNKQLVKIKTSYFIHNRIHVEKTVNAQKIVQMLFRVLRKADPTVLLLPFVKTTSQEKFIETEDKIPEDENELKTYLSVADQQYGKKFGFSLRISITEEPTVVKNRIFDWCKGQKHFVDFKQVGSANIFAAGWLYKLHQNYYNRDHIREWMTKNCPALEHHIHLAPAKIFKEDGEGANLKRILTYGIRVEVTFEQKEAILQQLYKLKWKEGPYKEALFVPFRKNQEFTNEMQIQLMKQHKKYMDSGIQQRVFRMKGADWEIMHQQKKEKTTFKKWMMGLTVNEKKILLSVETGDNHYVRMLYHPEDHKHIQYIFRHLYDTTAKTFGDENTAKMFCLPQSPLKGDVHALEENYAKTLQAALQSNPQQDEEDKARPKQAQRRQRGTNVYFGTSNVDRSYASITKTNTTEANNNGSNIKEDNNKKDSNLHPDDITSLKKSILKEVTQNVDMKLNNFESKIENKMQQLKDDNEAKIESLRELVQGSHTQTNNKLDTLLQHLIPPTQLKPPSEQVEQESSPRGGGQK